MLRRTLAIASVALLAAFAVRPTTARTLDEDGVVMLFPAKAGGTSYRLGVKDPREDPEHLKLWADTLTQITEDGVTFWRSTGHPVSYASGAPSGTSHRLMIFASGGRQTLNWQTGAIEKGYCGNPKDLNAFEATIYCRLHTLTGRHESVSWSLRGGAHNGPNSSSIGLSLRNPPGGRRGAYKELTWPKYGYADVTTQFDYTKTSGAWLGIKVISYIADSTRVRNLMYLDTDPYNENGEKKNQWRLYFEWFDTQGVAMGPYTQATLWAGWMNMFRVDGWTHLDFSILSAREIEPAAIRSDNSPANLANP